MSVLPIIFREFYKKSICDSSQLQIIHMCLLKNLKSYHEFLLKSCLRTSDFCLLTTHSLTGFLALGHGLASGPEPEVSKSWLEIHEEDAQSDLNRNSFSVHVAPYLSPLAIWFWLLTSNPDKNKDNSGLLPTFALTEWSQKWLLGMMKTYLIWLDLWLGYELTFVWCFKKNLVKI